MACTPKPVRKLQKAYTSKKLYGVPAEAAAVTKARRMLWLRMNNCPGVVHHRRKNRRPWLAERKA